MRQPGMAAVVLSAAMLQAFVPASAAVITHTGSGTYNYPPETTGAGDSVWAEDTTTVNLLTGGSIGMPLWAWDDSTVNVYGGSFGAELYALENTRLTIIGSGFNFDYGDYGSPDSLANEILTGTLLDGTAINNQVWILHSGTVTLAAVPEPSSFAVFGSAACGLILVRRRRTGSQRSAA